MFVYVFTSSFNKANFFRIDATKSDKLGRFLNDTKAKMANCRLKYAFVGGRTHMLFYAIKEIAQYQELV